MSKRIPDTNVSQLSVEIEEIDLQHISQENQWRFVTDLW